jgi:hypothetical protein
MYEQRGFLREVLKGKLATFAPWQRWGGNKS